MRAHPSRLRFPVLALCAAGVALWALPFLGVRATRGAATTGDEPQYLLSALSLGEDGSLDIADERAAGRYRTFHEVPLPIQEADRSDGRRISPHDPGLPALVALPMRLGGWRAVKATLAVLAGVLAALVAWTAHRRLEVPAPLAVGGAAAFACAPPLVVYATQVYPEVPAALTVTTAVAALLGPMRRAGPVTAALAVAALPWLSVKYAPTAVVLAVLVALRLGANRRWRALGALAAAWALLGALHVAVHVAVYGGITPYAAGTHFGAGEATVMGQSPDLAGRSLRLAGLLVDRHFGLLPWAPAYLLLAPALGAFVVRRPPGWTALLAPLAAGWATATWLALTMHGWWWPGRQVVVVLPLGVLGVLWWAGRDPRARAVLTVAAPVGWAVAAWLLIEGWRERFTLVVDVERAGGPVVAGLRRLLPDLARWSPADRVGLAAWAVVLAATAVAAGRAARRPATATDGDPRPGRGPTPASPGADPTGTRQARPPHAVAARLATRPAPVAMPYARPAPPAASRGGP